MPEIMVTIGQSRAFQLLQLALAYDVVYFPGKYLTLYRLILNAFSIIILLAVRNYQPKHRSNEHALI